MTAAHLAFALTTTACILVAIQLEERDLVHEHAPRTKTTVGPCRCCYCWVDASAEANPYYAGTITVTRRNVAGIAVVSADPLRFS